MTRDSVRVMDPRESNVFSRWFKCANCDRPEVESKFESSWECPACGENENGEEVTAVYQCEDCSLVAADKDFVESRCDCFVDRD